MAKPAPPSAYADKSSDSTSMTLTAQMTWSHELPTKLKRFDLNDSDFSADDESSTSRSSHPAARRVPMAKPAPPSDDVQVAILSTFAAPSPPPVTTRTTAAVATALLG